jgi:NTE family protein
MAEGSDSTRGEGGKAPPQREAEAVRGGQGAPAATGYEPVFAIFEGGGAKGITHVGALKAMEEERLALAGVAGTSAGAIIAALAAVGYRADELLDPGASTDILTRLGVTPLGVLGRRRWWALWLIRRFGPLLAILLASSVAALALGYALSLALLANSALVAMAAIALLLVLLLVPPLLRRGLFSSEKLTNVINTALREKLVQHHQVLGTGETVPERIRFSDMDPTVIPYCSPLKLIVSDIRSGKLVLFDREDGGVEVAEAVAASAAIPFAFTPPPIVGARRDGKPIYADGGLVSNLPAWSFAVEKRALERKQGGQPIPILAFSLKETPPARKAKVKAGSKAKPPPEQEAGLQAEAGQGGLAGGAAIATERAANAEAPPTQVEAAAPPPAPKVTAFAVAKAMSILDYVRRVLLTGIFGSQVVVEEFIADLNQIELDTPLETLSFDCTREQANAAHAAGFACASAALRRRRRTRMITDLLLTDIRDTMEAMVRATRTAKAADPPRLRLTLIDPSGPSRRPTAEFRVTASVGASDHSDDRLALDPRNLAAPQAYIQRKAIFAMVKDEPAANLWMTKYERALVWSDLCSIICIPVFGRPIPPGVQPPPPQRVLCLDSSDSLQDEFNDLNFMAVLTEASLNLSRTLITETVG